MLFTRAAFNPHFRVYRYFGRFYILQYRYRYLQNLSQKNCKRLCRPEFCCFLTLPLNLFFYSGFSFLCLADSHLEEAKSTIY
jgi:hypothetical protein